MSDTGAECDSYINPNQRGLKMTNPSTSLQKFDFNSNPLTVITDDNGDPSIFQSRHEPERRGYLINDSGSDGLGFID